MRASCAWLVLLTIGGLFACGESALEEAEPNLTALTYYGDTKPILDARCATCHQDGAVAPFNLTTYEEVVAVRSQAAAAIETGRMPPWKASDACRSYENDFSLTEHEKTRLLDWLAGGTPEGEPTDAPPERVITPLPAPDLVLQAATPYLPDGSQTDDYRCLVMAHTFAEDTFVTGIQVVPDATTIAHHAVLFMVPPESLPLLETKDLLDSGEGYTCFGSSGVAGATMIGGWAPGAELTQLLDPGVAQVIPAGSKLVNQMHYNLSGSEPIEDHTRLEIYTTDETPQYEIMSTFILDTSIEIPADDPAYVHERELPFTGAEPMHLVAAGAHMHLRGTSFRLTHVAADGTESCVVHVPDYDYNWQQQYRLWADEQLLVSPGDSFRIRCEYDNSAANQPVIDGVQVASVDLSWGDGTLEEMCLSGVAFRRPYLPDDGGGDGCDSDVSLCMATCDAPHSYRCLANCASSSISCMQCVLVGMLNGDLACAPDCLAEIAPQDCAQGCLAQALSGEGLGECMAEACPETLSALDACFEPVLEAGACDPLLASCSPE